MSELHPDPILAAYGLGIDFPKRFFLKVSRTDCCWPWEGAVRDTGYSKITCNERRGPSLSGQKAAWIIFNGEIPAGFELMNACPNHSRTCCNPNHWTLGQHGDIKRLRDAENANTPLTKKQLARAEAICVQSGTTMAEIEIMRTANHITPEWMVREGFSKNFANRWYAKVKITDTCWIWLACRNDDGYGHIAISSGTKTMSAHKASHMLHKGPVPENMDVLHNCAPNKDNPSCVNPAHLWTGTASENSIDASNKSWGRDRSHWNSSLSEVQVMEIFKMSKGGASNKEIADKFGKDPSHISKILHGQRWSRLRPD